MMEIKQPRKIAMWRILLVISILALITYLPLWPFHPVCLVKDKAVGKHLLEQRSELAITDIEALSTVLVDGGERYWCLGKYVFVPFSLMLNEELRWNYTMKAGIGCYDSRYHLEISPNGAPPVWVEF